MKTSGALRGLVLCVAALAAVTFGACGNSSPHSSATDNASSAASASSSGTVTVPSRVITKPRPKAIKLSPTRLSQLARGGAASFRKPRKDNSIPDYGREAHHSERQQVIAALSAFLRARANGQWATVCEYLARSSRHMPEELAAHSNGKLHGCGSALQELMTGSAAERADMFSSHGLASLRIKYPTAFALFYGTDGTKYVMPMQREGSKWKMTQMSPLPYPLGEPEHVEP